MNKNILAQSCYLQPGHVRTRERPSIQRDMDNGQETPIVNGNGEYSFHIDSEKTVGLAHFPHSGEVHNGTGETAVMDYQTDFPSLATPADFNRY